MRLNGKNPGVTQTYVPSRITELLVQAAQQGQAVQQVYGAGAEQALAAMQQQYPIYRGLGGNGLQLGGGGVLISAPEREKLDRDRQMMAAEIADLRRERDQLMALVADYKERWEEAVAELIKQNLPEIREPEPTAPDWIGALYRPYVSPI